MKNTQLLVNQMKILTERLEKLSPDSNWSRRASGVRGALLKTLPELEAALIDDEPGKESVYPNLDTIEYLFLYRTLTNSGSS
jgi:hypothetical protein